MGSVLLQQQMSVQRTRSTHPNGRTQAAPRSSAAQAPDVDDADLDAGPGSESKQSVATLRRHIAQQAQEREDLGNRRPHHKAWMYPELEWGMPPLMDVPRDYQNFLKVWEMITAIACLYVGFMVPFTLGFEKLYLSSGEQCLFRPSSDILPLFLVTRIIDIIVDLVFWIDIAVNFLSARWVLETEPMVHWTLVDDLRTVARLYLFDTFIIDLLGSLPVQYLDCISGVDGGSLKMMRMLRLFKLFRLRRLQTLINMVQKAFPGSAYVVAFVELFSKFFLVAHITACLFFWIAYGYADPDGTEYQQYLFSNGWVSGDGTLDEEGLVPENGTEPWVSAMYWAVTTMSTIGYGDISPYTSPERIVGMGLMVVGCAFFAWITGKITQLMTEKSSCDQRFDDIMEDLNTFMQQRHLPKGLCGRINDYYKVRFPNKKVFDEDNIINDIEAPALKKEIVHHLFRDVVEMVPLFKLATAETQREICFKLRSVYRMPGRVITVAGTVPDYMYMIRFGQVEIRSTGPSCRTATPGSIFGELAIMGLTPSNVRVRTAVASSVCELCELSKESFHDLLASQGGFFGLIRRASQMHLLMLRENFENAKARLSDSLQGGPGVEHFYDAMSHCQWEAVCAVLAEEQEADHIRKAHSRFHDNTVMDLEKITGQRMLLTTVKFQFNSLKALGKVRPGSFFMIVVTWPGVPSIPQTASRSETELFSAADSLETGSAIHKGIELPLIFPIGLRIKELSPFSITVLTLADGEASSPRKQSNPSAVSLSADLVNAIPEIRPDKSLVYPSSTPILGQFMPQKEFIYQRPKISQGNRCCSSVGTLPMEEAVVRRGKVSARRSFPVTMNRVNSTKASEVAIRSAVQLELTVDMFRKARCKAWGRIMHNVLGRGASNFFVKKMSELLDQIEDNDERFLSSIREKRLEVMASFASKKSKTAVGTSGAVPTAVLLDDFEEKDLAAVQGQDAHGADAGAKKMMQAIMQKLDQQGEELKAIKKALDQSPQTRQLASIAAPIKRPGPVSDVKLQHKDDSLIKSSIPLASGNMHPSAPLPSPRQHRLQQLKSTSVRGSREIGEG